MVRYLATIYIDKITLRLWFEQLEEAKALIRQLTFDKNFEHAELTTYVKDEFVLISNTRIDKDGVEVGY